MDFAVQCLFDTLDMVFKYNLKTGKMIFLKSDSPEIPVNIVLNEKETTQLFLHSKNIYRDDVPLFNIFSKPKEIKKLCNPGRSTVLFSARFIKNNKIKWTRVLVSVPLDFSEENQNILVIRRDLLKYESDQEEATTLFNQKIFKIVKHNFSTNETTILRERPSEKFIRHKYVKKSRLPEYWVLEENLIHPEDVETFLHFTNYDTIVEYFENGGTELGFYYRRKIGALYKWIRFTIKKSIYFTPENQIFFYYLEDVNQILLNLFNKQAQINYNAKSQIPSLKSEFYNENLLKILSFVTQRYIDFFMIDLKNDIYIMYKIKPENVKGHLPYIGSYSKLAQTFAANSKNSNTETFLTKYPNSVIITKNLLENPNFEFSFILPDGQPVKTICYKIESENGIPSKAICCTIPENTQDRLKVITFGNFQVFDKNGNPLKFTKKQSKQLLAYLISNQGYPVNTKEIVEVILEKDTDDENAIKYVSTLYRLLKQDLQKAGFKDVVVREWNTLRVQTEKIDCDYYHLLNGNNEYWTHYHNEFMKEYSWAESTNAEIYSMQNISSYE